MISSMNNKNHIYGSLKVLREAIGDTAQFESLQSLRCDFRWGLTGTPPTDVAQVARLCKIFQLAVPCERATAYGRQLAEEMCQRVLDHLARQNTSEELEAIELREHLVPVLQGPEERAIYLQACRDVAEASQGTEGLIKLCSHFGAYAGLAGAADARSECGRIVEIKENRAKKAYKEALQRAAQLELHWAGTTKRYADKEEILKHLGQSSDGREADLSAARVEVLGRNQSRNWPRAPFPRRFRSLSVPRRAPGGPLGSLTVAEDGWATLRRPRVHQELEP